jgi:ribonuclease HII
MSSKSLIAGIDEVGRGALAGPILACAAIFYTGNIPDGIDDSKKLTKLQREKLYDQLISNTIYGIGLVEAEVIDEIGIVKANDLAMIRAYNNLAVKPASVLIDGNRVPELGAPSEAIIGGDGKILEIGAASIIAKVTRDRIMNELHLLHPSYCWNKNVGYGTRQHIEAISINGLSSYHRKTFTNHLTVNI